MASLIAIPFAAAQDGESCPREMLESWLGTAQQVFGRFGENYRGQNTLNNVFDIQALRRELDMSERPPCADATYLAVQGMLNLTADSIVASLLDDNEAADELSGLAREQQEQARDLLDDLEELLALQQTVRVTVNQGANSANIRTGPGFNYQPIGRLVEGEVATAIGRDANSDWLLIDENGSRWVGRWNVTLTSDISVLPVREARLILASFDSCVDVNELAGPLSAVNSEGSQMDVSYVAEPERGCAARLTYTIEDASAFVMQWQGIDLRAYSTLSFDIRAEEPNALEQFKLELNREDGRAVLYVTEEITEEWLTVEISLANFVPQPDFLLAYLQALAFGFEVDRSGPAGTVFLDNVILRP